LVQNRFQTHIGLLDSGSAAGMTERGCHPEDVIPEINSGQALDPDPGSVSGSVSEPSRLNGFRLGGRNDNEGLRFSTYCLLLTSYFFFLSLTSYFLLPAASSSNVVERTNG
jgi:hypothetical protein